MRLHAGAQEVRLTEAVRGIPQGSLHEGGGPQGLSSALRSMVPSALLHAKTVTTNRLGGKGGGGKRVKGVRSGGKKGVPVCGFAYFLSTFADLCPGLGLGRRSHFNFLLH